jgi:hypothetical protein
MKHSSLNLKAFLVCFFISTSAVATSYVNLAISDQDIIKYSVDVVEGKVVDVKTIKRRFFSFDEPCFSQVYKLEVLKSRKGTYKNGDVIIIGIGKKWQSIKNGEEQIVMLNSISEHVYDECSFDQHVIGSNRKNILMPYSQPSGLFHIYPHDNGEKKFKIESCDKKPTFIYAEFFEQLKATLEKNRRGKLECNTLIGSYEELVKKLWGEPNN